MRGDGDGLAQALPVDSRGAERQVVVVVHHEPLEVDRAQVAALVGDQGLLAAGVGGLVKTHPGHRAVVVHPVDEHHPRLAGRVSASSNPLEDLAGVELARHLTRAGVHQVVGGAGLHRGHKGVGDGDRDVEVGEPGQVLLVVDERHDVGVIDPEDAHVGAPAHAALLDRLGGRIEDLHERDRARADAHGRAHEVALGAQPGESEARAAAELVDERRLLHRLENAGQVVGHGQDETGTQVHPETRIGDGRAIGQKIEAVGQLEEPFGGGCNLFFRGPVLAVGLGEGAGDPSKQGFRGFDDFPVGALAEVALFKHRDGIT
ncbi:hypothetical protein D3C72_815370 [compost metagenome]